MNLRHTDFKDDESGCVQQTLQLPRAYSCNQNHNILMLEKITTAAELNNEAQRYESAIERGQDEVSPVI